MDQYAGSPGCSNECYTELAVSFINFLHYCSTLSILWCRERTDRQSRLSVPSLPSSTIFTTNALSAAALPIYPGVGQAPTNASLLGLLAEKSWCEKSGKWPLSWWWCVLFVDELISDTMLCCGLQAESFDASGSPVVAVKGCRLSDWGGECAVLA